MPKERKSGGVGNLPSHDHFLRFSDENALSDHSIDLMPKSEYGRLFAVKVLEIFRSHLVQGSAVREVIDNLVNKMALLLPSEELEPGDKRGKP